MTHDDDLKMAEEYVATIHFDNEWSNDALGEIMSKAYLAGLEAGRSKWISVKERMPEEYANVLVAGREPRHLASIATYIFEEEKRKWCQREKEVLVLPTDNWMPLPDAPKGPEGE